MSEYIYVKLGDPIYEETFKERFKGFILSIHGNDGDEHRFTLSTSQLLKYLKTEIDEIYTREIKRCEQEEME